MDIGWGFDRVRLFVLKVMHFFLKTLAICFVISGFSGNPTQLNSTQELNAEVQTMEASVEAACVPGTSEQGIQRVLFCTLVHFCS